MFVNINTEVKIASKNKTLTFKYLDVIIRKDV